MLFLDLKRPVRFLFTFVLSCVLLVAIATYFDIIVAEYTSGYSDKLGDAEESVPVFSPTRGTLIAEMVRRIGNFYRFGW